MTDDPIDHKTVKYWWVVRNREGTEVRRWRADCDEYGVFHEPVVITFDPPLEVENATLGLEPSPPLTGGASWRPITWTTGLEWTR